MESAVEKIAGEIEKLRHIVEGLKNFGQEFPALDRNVNRMAACLKMLELNFIDPFIDGS